MEILRILKYIFLCVSVEKTAKTKLNIKPIFGKIHLSITITWLKIRHTSQELLLKMGTEIFKTDASYADQHP